MFADNNKRSNDGAEEEPSSEDNIFADSEFEDIFKGGEDLGTKK